MDDFHGWVASVTGADSVGNAEMVQSLWSGYGRIVRLPLVGAPGRSSVIVKQISPPDQGGSHPRGWSGELAHDRKLRSYEVETSWYQSWSGRCSTRCRVPVHLASTESGGSRLLLLEDLDASGFDQRHHRLSDSQLADCLRWLASFHATFLGADPEGLWPVGTYWHLETRPGEWEAMPSGPLKNAAAAIDQRLSTCRFRAVVHGDAKVANFCFDDRAGKVAAVDFQYVGGGCGMKDVAYFLGSCMSDEELSERCDECLAIYFESLNEQLGPDTADAVIDEWTELFPWAWADFHRFLSGWCATHPKLTEFSHRMVESVVRSI